MSLALALSVSFIYWLAVYGGYRLAGEDISHRMPSIEDLAGFDRLRPLLVGAGMLAVSVGAALYLAPTRAALDGSIYLQSRMGVGLLWLLPELFIPDSSPFSDVSPCGPIFWGDDRYFSCWS